MEIKINIRLEQQKKKADLINQGFKKCATCKELLSVKDFTRNVAKGSCGYKSSCKKCLAEYNRTKRKDYWIRFAYGQSEGWYNDLVIKQEGKCAICKKESKLVVDHCHTNGNTRELLCNNCNAALGMSGENIITLQNMINYIIKHNGHSNNT